EWAKPRIRPLGVLRVAFLRNRKRTLEMPSRIRPRFARGFRGSLPSSNRRKTGNRLPNPANRVVRVHVGKSWFSSPTGIVAFRSILLPKPDAPAKPLGGTADDRMHPSLRGPAKR